MYAGRSIMSDTVTPWIVAHQSPLSMGFSRQEYWSGLPFPSSGDLPDPGIEPGSPALQAHSLPSESREDYEGEWIHVYLWLNPLAVHLKLSQYC